MTDYPITPPPELVEQWVQATESNDCIGAFPTNFEKRICTAAARWGADQELEACCQVLYARYDIPNCIAPKMAEDMREWLRAARRPKPPSLKERALMALEDGDIGPGASLTPVEVCIIRRALEALPD